MVKMGMPAKEAHLQPVPQPFDTWMMSEDHFVANLEFLYKEASQKGS
jgi:hypothetical protein